MITIKELLTAYKNGEITPERYIKERLKEATRLKDYNIWTYLLSWEEIAPYIENLHGADIDKFPLYGVPFAIKDNIDEANEVLTIAEGFDARDAYSRPNPYSNSTRNYGVVNGSITLGLIAKDQLNFFGDPAYEKAYQASIEALLQIPGLTVQEIDYAPFEEAAKLLYEGPWVAERYIAAMPLIEQNPQAVHPVVREIIEQGKDRNACELFKAEYRLHALKQSCDQALAGMDALLIPTAGRFFTIEDLAKEPIRHNSDLGHYTNFMNLLDYCGLALPWKRY